MISGILTFIRPILCLVLAAATAAGTPAVARDSQAQAPPDDVTAPQRFLDELKRHVARDNRDEVAEMIQYPILVNAGTLRIPIADSKALLERYDLIFSAELKTAIAQSAFQPPGSPRRRYAAAASSDAMTIAGGYVGAEKINGVFRITRISLANVGGDPAANNSSPREPVTARRTPGTPERLTARGRMRMAQATGTLAVGETRTYVIWAGQGQMLDVRVDGVQGRDILLRVSNARTGTHIDARAKAGVRRWSGRVSAGADYRIELARGDGAKTAARRYVLVVTVN
jgi:hypothetical protein